MANKLLLLEDVDALGRSGDIVSVKPGFARNFLLPQGLAVVADKSALRMQAKLQEERKKRAIVDKQESEKLAASLEGIVVKTVVKVDHDGHMYGSVSALDIVHLLEQQSSLKLEKRFIHLKHAIKETGVHNIHAKLKEGVTADFKLKIMAEGAVEEDEPVEEQQAEEQ